MRRLRVIIIIVVTVVLMGAAAVFLCQKGILHLPKGVKHALGIEKVEARRMSKSDKVYSAMLPDIQRVQIKAATANGIKPQQNGSNIHKLVAEKKLVKANSCKSMNLGDATYPYLTPDAYDLLLEISKRYQKKLGAQSRLKVSSCLRTKDQIKELMKTNPNATRYSCHLYGTTFDISYLGMSEKKKETLARVLKELRDAGFLYAKYEIGQKCFHITLRKPGKFTKAT